MDTHTLAHKETHTNAASAQQQNNGCLLKGVGFPSLSGRLEGGGGGLLNCLTFIELINSTIVSLESEGEREKGGQASLAEAVFSCTSVSLQGELVDVCVATAVPLVACDEARTDVLRDRGNACTCASKDKPPGDAQKVSEVLLVFDGQVQKGKRGRGEKKGRNGG